MNNYIVSNLQYIYDKYILKHIFKINNNYVIARLKKKYIHSNRETFYKGVSYGLDSLYCHAVPGTLEQVILFLSDISKKNNHKKMTLLNVGGGTGQVSNIFREIGFDTYNLDLEVKKTSKRNIQFDLNSTNKIGINNDYFDVVVAQEIIEHIENPWSLIRRAYTHLKVGGKLVITTPNITSSMSKNIFVNTNYFHWFTPNSFDFHINPLCYWEIEFILSKIGFRNVKIFGSGEYYFGKEIDKVSILKNNEGLLFMATK